MRGMSAALWLCRVDGDAVIRLLQVVIAGVGLVIAQRGAAEHGAGPGAEGRER